MMWCVGKLNREYRQRMYALLELYARPLPKGEVLVCADEKSTQLLAHSQAPLPMHPGAVSKQDYEYVRGGTRNLFVAVEPRAGQKWPRLFEQQTPIYKWKAGGLETRQSCPRRRASGTTNAKPRWATRGAGEYVNGQRLSLAAHTHFFQRRSLLRSRLVNGQERRLAARIRALPPL